MSTARMAGSGFRVSPGSLTAASQQFSDAVPTMALHVEVVNAALGVSTGSPALDALIARLAGQVSDSLAGTGQALQADSTGLAQNASTYVAADQASAPNVPAAAHGRLNVR
jgi:hypothetical protein